MAGQIQGSINNILGMAAVAKMLDPRARKKEELKNLSKQEQLLNAQVEAAGDKPLESQIADDISGKLKDVAKRKFELDPTQETYQEYAKQIPKTIKEDPEMIHQERMEGIPDLAKRNAEYSHAYQQAYKKEMSNLEMQQQAMGRMSRQTEAKKTQRRNFMDYLAKQPTSLGGTIGELPKSTQKQIASQYTKSQRKTMMDRMDKEAKNGK